MSARRASRNAGDASFAIFARSSPRRLPLPRRSAQMRTLFAFAHAATVLTAPALARDAQRVPDAMPDGKAVSSIPLSSIQASHVRSDDVIDFEMIGGKVYRNTLPQSCPSLGFEQHFSYETSLSQLCSTDIIIVSSTSPPMRGPSCGLGEFQPVKLVR